MHTVIRVSLALAVAAASALSGDAARADDVRQITVSGEGTVSIAPDSAYLRAGVITEGKTAKDAGDANAKAMASVMAAIKEAGIADKDVQTSRYSIRPVYEGGRPVRERITGFQAANSVLLTLRDLDKIGGLIDRVIAAGANDMGGVEFVVSDSSKALDPARAEAMADARRKAEAFAKAAGVKVGAPLTIHEQSTAPPRYYPMMLRAAPAPADTPVASGEQSLRVTVTVSFELLR